jgi:hypothetical protein
MKSFRTDRLERELQMVKLSGTRCSCIVIFRVSLVNFDYITLCVASQRVIPKVRVYFVMTQSGNFWIHPRKLTLWKKLQKSAGHFTVSTDSAYRPLGREDAP